MAQFEHKSIHFNGKGDGFTKMEFNHGEIEHTLNRLGREGWRVVSNFPVVINGFTTDVYYTLVRELNN